MDSSLVYLVQTDTTVGFLSQETNRLALAKQRDPKKKILQTVDSFFILSSLQRVPNRFKKRVRNSRKTTFIYPNKKAFRVVSNGEHHQFLKKFHAMYSTSANLTTKEFSFDIAKKQSDIIVYTNTPFSEKTASSIFQLGIKKLRKIR